jgi:hypothetical protein
MNSVELIQTVIEFMGWSNMPANVALDAIKTIVRNIICITNDCTGDTPDFEEELKCLSDMVRLHDYTKRDVYIKLFVEDYETLHDIHMQDLAWALRGEIIDLMNHGVLFKDARREYDI